MFDDFLLLCTEEIAENMPLKDFADYITNILENTYPSLKKDDSTNNLFSINRKRTHRLLNSFDKCPLNVKNIEYIICLLNLKLVRLKFVFDEDVMMFIHLSYFCHYKIFRIIDHFPATFKPEMIGSIIKDLNGLLFKSKYILFRCLLPSPQFSNEEVFLIVFSNKDYNIQMEDSYYDSQVRNNMKDLYTFLHSETPLDDLFAKTLAVNYFYLYPFKKNVENEEFKKTFQETATTTTTTTTTTSTTTNNTTTTEVITLHQSFRQHIHYIKYSFKNLAYLTHCDKRYILDKMPSPTLFGILFSMLMYIQRKFNFEMDILMFLIYGMSTNKNIEEIKTVIQKTYDIKTLTTLNIPKQIEKSNLTLLSETEFQIHLIKEYVKMFGKHCSFQKIPNFKKLITLSYVDCNSPYTFQYFLDAYTNLQNVVVKKEIDSLYKDYCKIYNEKMFLYHSKKKQLSLPEQQNTNYKTMKDKIKRDIEKFESFLKSINDNTEIFLYGYNKKVEEALKEIFLGNLPDTTSLKGITTLLQPELQKLIFETKTVDFDSVISDNQKKRIQEILNFYLLKLNKVFKLLLSIAKIVSTTKVINNDSSLEGLYNTFTSSIRLFIVPESNNFLTTKLKQSYKKIKEKEKIIEEFLKVPFGSSLDAKYDKLIISSKDAFYFSLQSIKDGTITANFFNESSNELVKKLLTINIYEENSNADLQLLLQQETDTDNQNFLKKLIALNKLYVFEEKEKENPISKVSEDFEEEQYEDTEAEDKIDSEKASADGIKVREFKKKLDNLKIDNPTQKLFTPEVFDKLKDVYLKQQKEKFEKNIPYDDTYDLNQYVNLCSLFLDNLTLLDDSDLTDDVEKGEDLETYFKRNYDKSKTIDNDKVSTSFMFWLKDYLKTSYPDFIFTFKKIYISFDLLKGEDVLKDKLPVNFKQSTKRNQERFITELEIVEEDYKEHHDVITQYESTKDIKPILMDISTLLDKTGQPKFQQYIKTLLYNCFQEKTNLLKKINKMELIEKDIKTKTEQLKQLV
jgi:hypothetical protein